MTSSVNVRDFRIGMRHLAASVCVVTSCKSDKRVGMTVTAVSSVSAEPPVLLICINSAAKSHDSIRQNGRFVVNVLSSTDLSIARQFTATDMDSRFSVGSWVKLESGGAALSSALAVFDCRVQHEISVGTHTVLFGLIEQVIVERSGQPLLYWDGHFATPNDLVVNQE